MKSILSLFVCTVFLNVTSAQRITQISVKNAEEDLKVLITKFDNIHYNPCFFYKKEEIMKEKTRLTSSWTGDSISFKSFMEVGMRMTAMMSGGHSYFEWQTTQIFEELSAYTFLPFTGKLERNGEELAVTKSCLKELSENEKIKRINGKKVDEIYKDCMNYFGGLDAYKNESASLLFPISLFFNQSIIAPFSIETSSGSIIQSEGVSFNEIAGLLQEQVVNIPYEFEVLDGNIGWIKYNQCSGHKQFKKFLKTTFKEIKESGIDKLIIDIRKNGGGNSALNDELLNYLTTKEYRQSSKRYWKVSKESKTAYNSNLHKKVFGKKFINEYLKRPEGSTFFTEVEELTVPKRKKNFFKGKHCFLVGTGTFSSANFLADAVKTYRLSTLIGTSTGEATNDFGEQISFQLPNSKCFVYVSSTYDIGANANEKILAPVFPDVEDNVEPLKTAIEWLKKK